MGDTTDFSELSADEASRFLELGLTGPRRPADDLVDRLCQPDGDVWLNNTLQSGPTGSFGEPREYLVNGKATLDQLVAAKQASKSLMHAEVDDTVRLAALTGYFFSIATALAHHQQTICSRSREELDPILLDLAAVSPEPWASLLADAVKNAP